MDSGNHAELANSCEATQDDPLEAFIESMVGLDLSAEFRSDRRSLVNSTENTSKTDCGATSATSDSPSKGRKSKSSIESHSGSSLVLSLCHLGHLERGVDAIHDAIGYLASILFAQSSFPSGNWDNADLIIDLYS